MGSERVNYNPYLIKTAGLLAIFSGIITFGAFFYLMIVLGSLGLKLEMYEQTEALLKWIVNNRLEYKLLWLQHALAAILMLPVPLATSQVFRQRSSRSSSLATASYFMGLCGFYLLILAAVIFYAVSPVTALALKQNVVNANLLQEIFAELGLQFRVLGEFLIGMWLAAIGIHLVRKNRVDSFGWYTLLLFAAIALITIGKSFNIYDWEPLLGILLSLTYIWLGKIMRDKAK